VKLTELDATFVGEYSAGGFRHLPNVNGAQGVLFRCPKVGCQHSIVVWFGNPTSAPQVPPDAVPKMRWAMSGDSIASLTLSPSIHIPDDWHGWIQNGDAVGVGP
jgi:hypothetical protein